MTWYDTIYRKRKSLAHWQITCGPSEREVKEIKSDMRNKFKHGSLCWEMIPSIALYCWDNRCKSSKKEETFCFFVVSCRNRRSPSLCCVWPLQKTEMPSQETQVETSWCGEKACSLIQVQWEEFSPSYMGVSIYTNIKTSKLHHLPFYLWLIWWAPRPSVCLSVCLSACPLICPLQAVDLYVRPTEPSHPSHPISVTQALIASATSSKGLMRAASLLCPRWGTARWCPEGRTAGSSAGTAATSRYKQWRWEKVQQKSEFPPLEISLNRTSSQG